MGFKRIVTVFALAGLTFSAAGVAAAAEKEEQINLTRLGNIIPTVPESTSSLVVKRPGVVSVLYISLGAMQVLDVYSTQSALKAGAREANPTAAPFAGNVGSMLGLKAATTAGTIFFAERLWKTNKVAAIVMLTAINGSVAAVSMHNLRNAKMAARR